MNQTAQPPRAITWTGYLAITFLIILPLAVLTVRSGAWQQGLLLYALACFGSIVLLIFFVLAMLLPKWAEHRSAVRARALFTLPGTIALLSITLGAGDHPRIHDITTDTADPPVFAMAASQRGDGANPLTIKPEVIAQQQAAYADLAPVQSSLNPAAAFERALQIAQEMEWAIYHQNETAGVIEAVATTGIMLFKDDVVIRIRPDAGGSVIDLRSVSRVGESDLGANAARIRSFIDAFNAG